MLMYIAAVMIQLIMLAVCLLFLSVPIFIILAVKRKLSRGLQPIANILLIPLVLLVAGFGVSGVLMAFGVDLGGDKECFERHFNDEQVVISPTGQRKAILSTGVCVTGFLAPDSYDGIHIEITKAGTGKREVVFKGYGRSDNAIDLEWNGDGVLRARLRKTVPVGKSLHKVDNVVLEYYVSPEALAPLPTNPEQAARFRKWATDNAVID